ncbi:MAG: hypothetical protein IPN29_06370 [Saprospiraceae bacterium]|nr:hypothetical protein [Saprospiraceae bacterium]
MDTLYLSLGETQVVLINTSEAISGDCTQDPQWWIALNTQTGSLFQLELTHLNQLITT